MSGGCIDYYNFYVVGRKGECMGQERWVCRLRVECAADEKVGGAWG